MMGRFSDVCPQCGRVRVHYALGPATLPCDCTIKRWPRRRRRGIAHDKAWRFVERTGQTECHWCRLPFAEKNPPTLDHVVPRSAGGRGEFVAACRLCNNARGAAPFDEYAAAVAQAWAFVEVDPKRSGYRRPKYRQTRDGFVIQ